MKFVLACDEGYFKYAYISILSLLEHNKAYNDLKIVFIEQNISKDNLQKLYELGMKYEREINIIPFEIPEEYDKLPSYGNSKTTFAKFLFSSLFDDDIVIFLDPDTLVLGDLSEFEKIDMEGYMFAGVLENLPKYHRDLANSQNEAYINGGVLICNLKEWRKTDFESRVFEYMKNNNQNFNYDQGILNEMCSGKIKVIEPRFNSLAEIFELKKAGKIKKRYKFKNYYSQEEIDTAINKPIVVHFTYFLYGKPLMEGCEHPYTNVFLKYLFRSPLNHNLYKNNLNIKIKIRRFILRRLPFSVYCTFERILDFRRFRDLKKQLKK